MSTYDDFSFVVFKNYYYLNFILCVWVICLHACLCTTFVPAALGGQKRMLAPLELKL